MDKEQAFKDAVAFLWTLSGTFDNPVANAFFGMYPDLKPDKKE